MYFSRWKFFIIFFLLNLTSNVRLVPMLKFNRQATTDEPTPNSIGFERIIILHLDDEVLNILRIIIHLLKGIPMTIVDGPNLDCATDEKLRSHLNVGRLSQMNKLFNIFRGHVTLFECHRRTFVHLFNAENSSFLHPIKYLRVPFGWSANEDQHVTEQQFMPLLAAWLNSPSASGDPKLIFEHFLKPNQLVNLVREKFLASTMPAPFLLHFDTLPETPKHFRIENNATGEELIVGWHYHGDGSYFVLRRFPKGDDTTWRTMIEQEDQLLMRNKIDAMSHVQLYLDEI